MTFLHPSIFLAGLACIAIPIAIHVLMRRRRRPVAWGAMRFLMEAYRKQRRRLALEQWVLLALRCLLVGLLGIGLARPMLGAAGVMRGAGPRTVLLVLDNSLASSAVGADGESRLEKDKARAERVLDELDASRGDRAGLIVLGAPAEAVVSPASVDIDGVRAAVKQVRWTDGPADWTGAAASVAAAIEARVAGDPPGSVVILSGLRAGSVDVKRAPPKLAGLRAAELGGGAGLAGAGTGGGAGVSASGGARVLVSRPDEEGIDNVTVMEVEALRGVMLRPAGAERAGEAVRVTLRRSGPGVSRAGVTEVRVQLEPAGVGAGAERAGTAVVRWASGQEEATTSVVAPAGGGGLAGGLAGGLGGSGLMVLAARVDHDAVTGDNVRRRPVRVSEAVEVAVISPPVGLAQTIDRFTPTDWYRLALNPEGETGSGEVRATVIESSQAGLRPLAGFDAVIAPYPDTLDEGAWRNLAAFVRGGGVLIVSPPPGEAVNIWTDAMTRALGLPWRIGREPRDLGEGAGVVSGRGAAESLLGLLGGEMEELLKPVRVRKVLDVDPADVSATVELRVQEEGGPGAPLLIVGEGGSGIAGATGVDKAGGAGGAGDGRIGGVSAGGRGVVAMLTAAPDLAWTDLPVRPMMVPLLQELVRQGAGRAGRGKARRDRAC